MDIDWTELNLIIYDHIEKILNLFGIDYTDRNNGEYAMACPLHDGDNPTACRIYPSGSFWCFSRGCATDGSSLITFLKLLIEKHENIEINLLYVIDWFVNNILEGKDILALPKSAVKKIKIVHKDRVFFEDINQWWDFAEKPSQHYAKEFNEDIIARYHIGECRNKRERFYNRIVVPHLSGSGAVLGYVGRSLYPKCLRCKLYHSLSAPCPTSDLGYYAKWKTAYRFKVGHYVYNSWTWEQNKPRHIILVESVGNCLRLVQSGYNHCGGLYGSSLSQGQADLLEKAGVQRITWIVDNDVNKAGVTGATKSAEKYRQFQYRILIPPGVNDIKEMSVANLQQFLTISGIRI